MPICLSCVALWATVGTVGYFLYKKFYSSEKAEPEVQKKDWKKDVVYLYQFPRPKGLANYSPYCMKVEMFLRVNDIKYENVFTSFGRSKYGLLPFIELNGVHYADSQLIVEVLKDHFKIKPVDSREEGFARAVERLVDTHTCSLFIKYKFLEETGYFDSLANLLGLKFPLSLLVAVMKPFITKKVRGRVYTIVGGEFTEDEFHSLLKKDLNALRDILGDRQYLLGDKIHAVDCAVFSQLATLCYLKNNTEVKRLVAAEYPTLMQYQDRIIKKVFPAEFK